MTSEQKFLLQINQTLYHEKKEATKRQAFIEHVSLFQKPLQLLVLQNKINCRTIVK